MIYQIRTDNSGHSGQPRPGQRAFVPRQRRTSIRIEQRDAVTRNAPTGEIVEWLKFVDTKNVLYAACPFWRSAGRYWFANIEKGLPCWVSRLKNYKYDVPT